MTSRQGFTDFPGQQPQLSPLARRTWSKPDFSGLGIRNLLDGNGECSGVDGRAASSGDGAGEGSGGGGEGLGTGVPGTAARTPASGARDADGMAADGRHE